MATDPLATLARLAAAATPGPWKWREPGKMAPGDPWAEADSEIQYRLLDAPGRSVLEHAHRWQIRDAEADFIAAADPTTVARLVRVAEAARACIQSGVDEDEGQWVALNPAGQVELHAALAALDLLGGTDPFPPNEAERRNDPYR